MSKKIKLFCILFICIFFNQNSFANMSKINAHQFSFNLLDGKTTDLSSFKGKVILVVNTASKCGFTPQYAGLQNLHNKYSSKGLVVIGVPSADFASQEFASEKEVETFTKKEFSVDFPLSEISSVKGSNAHPFYKWANKEAGILGSPKWNFHKYLIDKNGNLAAWYSSPTSPESAKIINKIEELL